MEDAMILNKGAYERGFGHGCVYKNYYRELNESNNKSRFKMFHSSKSNEIEDLDLASHGL